MILTHPNEPKTVFCRAIQVMRWTGWSRNYLNKLAEGKILRTKAIQVNGERAHRFFYTSQVKRLIEEDEKE